MNDDRVFGMGAEPVVAREWPSLTLDEVGEVLGGGVAEIEWRSPRPLSTTARIRTEDGERLIVKRLPLALRTPEALAEEHGFMDHLREHGVPVPNARTAGTRGDFVYEVQELGTGKDWYQGEFSWTPYRGTVAAAAAGHLLGKLHDAATGYQAPARPWRPLKGGDSIFGSPDPIAAIEALTVERPLLADFLEARDWRSDVERLLLPFHSTLDVEPLWTHNDFHATNILWEPLEVIDFGLSDRTTALHDLAIAVERFAVDWVSIRDGGGANVQREQLELFLHWYRRPTQGLALVFPLCHADYQLSEIDYFLSVVPGGNEKNAEIAYRDWFLGHAEWLKTEEGQAFLGLLGS